MWQRCMPPWLEGRRQKSPRFNKEYSGSEVLLPNNNTIVFTSQGHLPLPSTLSPKGNNAMIFSGLKSAL